MSDRALVHVDIAGEPVLAAIAHFTTRAGALVSTVVTYEPAYVARRDAFPLEPALPLMEGGQHVDGLPGFLADCSPDRWGRNLIRKRHLASRHEGRPAPTLTDIDYLMSVSDVSRQGAVRLRTEAGGPFVAEGSEVPKLIDLPRLLNAADGVDDEGDLAAIKALLDAGSGSLGGARPKASVRDDGRLLIAKFPHQHDEWDVMAWEKLTLDIAADAGIVVPANRIHRVDGRGVLLLDRFDRDGETRIPYISAMTLLGARDGDPHDYDEVAEALAEVSATASQDLRQLWRRILFMAVVGSTDDHLRNHGFLHGRSGWRLAPAFDMNPNPEGSRARVTSVYGASDRAGVFEALHAHSADFRMSEADASLAASQVTEVVSTWRDRAKQMHISSREIDLMAAAFEAVP